MLKTISEGSTTQPSDRTSDVKPNYARLKWLRPKVRHRRLPLDCRPEETEQADQTSVLLGAYRFIKAGGRKREKRKWEGEQERKEKGHHSLSLQYWGT
jgi:hypothetical protein